MKIDIPPFLLPFLARLSKFRTFAVTLTILAIVGCTGYQMSKAVSVTPTEASIEAAKEKLTPTAVKFDMTTINNITRHIPVKVTPDLGGLGTTNPFYGQ